MKIAYKKIIIFILAFSFSSTLIFCCAFQDAQASAVDHCDHDQAEHGHDQSDKADHHHDSHSPHNCMCQQTFIADFSKSFNIQLVSSSLFNKFLKDAMAFDHSFNTASLSQATLLADRSPPLLAAVLVPIYLKISNFRL